MYGSIISRYSFSSSSDRFILNRLAMLRISESVGRFTVMFVTTLAAACSIAVTAWDLVCVVDAA